MLNGLVASGWHFLPALGSGVTDRWRRGAPQSNRAAESPPAMPSHRLTLFADYHQFYLQDEAAPGDLASAWDEAATLRMLAVSQGVVGFGTARNMPVPVTLELLEAEPQTDLARFDHVVDGSVAIATGPLVVAGCTDYLPDAARFDVPPGAYRVRLSSAGLDSLSPDGLEGEDRYLVQMWPGALLEPTVLKQHAG